MQMDDNLFEQLVRSSEGSTVDFKREFYKFPDDAHGSAQDDTLCFVKDVTAFYNTKRNSDAYIIFGIAENGGVPGISEFYDNATLQEKIQDKIAPIPIFKAYKYIYNGNLPDYAGKTFYIIEIALPEHNSPATVQKDQSVKKYPKSPKPKLVEIKCGQVYIRKNSRNTIAIGNDLTTLHNWLQELDEKRKKYTKGDYDIELFNYINNKTSANAKHLLEIGKKVGLSPEQIESDARHTEKQYGRGCGYLVFLLLIASFYMYEYQEDFRKQEKIRTIDALVSKGRYLEALQKIPEAYSSDEWNEEEQKSIGIIEIAVTKADTSIGELTKAFNLYNYNSVSYNRLYYDLIRKSTLRLCSVSKCEEAKKIIIMSLLDEESKQKISREIDNWQPK